MKPTAYYITATDSEDTIRARFEGSNQLEAFAKFCETFTDLKGAKIIIEEISE